MSTGHSLGRPRILLLNSTLGIGGAENVTAALCRGIDREKFDVVVGHLKWRGAIGDELAEEGFKVVSLEADTRGKPDYLSALRLRHFLADEGVDLVHSNDLHAMIDAAICRMSLRNLRQVSTFHFGNYPHGSRRYHLAEKYLSRVPDRLVAVGQVQRQRLLDTYRFKEGRLGLVRNGVPDVCAHASDGLKSRIRADGKVVIGSVSTLIEQKGITYLLNVADRLKRQSHPFKLVIVGEGHLRPSLEAMAEALGLSADVEFYGWVDNAPQRVLPWIDVFVQTSLWEAMSMVVLEAMSCGLPIVATTVGENPYVIRDGENGFLASPKDVDRIAERLGQLIQSPQLRRQLGQQARSDWEKHYTAGRMCQEYEALYMEVLSEGRAPVRT
jgi:glycosyltransferase involved in cell wall biosynthesis